MGYSKGHIQFRSFKSTNTIDSKPQDNLHAIEKPIDNGLTTALQSFKLELFKKNLC